MTLWPIGAGHCHCHFWMTDNCVLTLTLRAPFSGQVVGAGSVLLWSSNYKFFLPHFTVGRWCHYSREVGSIASEQPRPREQFPSRSFAFATCSIGRNGKKRPMSRATGLADALRLREAVV